MIPQHIFMDIDKRNTFIISFLYLAHVRWVKPLVLHRVLPVREPIKLQCIADGKPEPTYTWMQNETEITAR